MAVHESEQSAASSPRTWCIAASLKLAEPAKPEPKMDSCLHVAQ